MYDFEKKALMAVGQGGAITLKMVAKYGAIAFASFVVLPHAPVLGLLGVGFIAYRGCIGLASQMFGLFKSDKERAATRARAEVNRGLAQAGTHRPPLPTPPPPKTRMQKLQDVEEAYRVDILAANSLPDPLMADMALQAAAHRKHDRIIQILQEG